MDSFSGDVGPEAGRGRDGADVEDALARVEAELGRDRPAVVDGERLALPIGAEIRDPEDPDVLLSRFPVCGTEHLISALEASADAADSWAATPWADRAHLLFEAAERVRRERHYYAAWTLLEAGLPWEAAEAEVVAGIDALEGVAREAVRRGTGAEGAPGGAPAPLGPGVLLAPRERAFSLSVAVASAALAAGNPVVLVPAARTATIGSLVFGLLEHVGAPRGTIHFLPGPAADLGRAALARDDARFVACASTLDLGLPPSSGGTAVLELRDVGAQGRRAILLGPAALHGSLRPRALLDAFLRP
ncbi:MAG TPA: aldehyde dehydrogenase family protein [Planctomycetota bacterium]|nr:aldehyde dehydrogenase family protein [Planctomycetota bacterium]